MCCHLRTSKKRPEKDKRKGTLGAQPVYKSIGKEEKNASTTLVRVPSGIGRLDELGRGGGFATHGKMEWVRGSSLTRVTPTRRTQK